VASSQPRGIFILDYTAILENNLVVVDDEVPGDSQPQARLYECKECHRTVVSEYPPECHGKKMSPKE
jgi:hypothetical protein